MIKIKNLRFKYPTGLTALKFINLEIKQGDRIGIIGQNGSGKTTLVKHFNGLLKPTAGDVIVKGFDTEEKTIAELSKIVGFIFQNPNDQIFNATLKSEVEFGLKQMKLSKSEISKRVKYYLTKVNLWNKRNKHPSELNYAERKLLSISSILAMNPEVIIFDEPTTGQDFIGTKEAIKIINSLKDKTVIVVSHDMNVIAETCNKLIVMSEGKILANDDALKVFQQKNILKKAFVEPPEVLQACEELGITPVLTRKEFFKKF